MSDTLCTQRIPTTSGVRCREKNLEESRREEGARGEKLLADTAFYGRALAGPPGLPSAPPPPAAVTRETGRYRPPADLSEFHGSHEESSLGAVGGSSGPGHKLDALFGFQSQNSRTS